MAADGVPDARREAVLRAARTSRRIRGMACRRSAQVLAGIAEAWRERRDELVDARVANDRRAASRGSERLTRIARAADGPRDAFGVRAAASGVRQRARRVRRRAEVPAADDARVRAALRRAWMGAREQIVTTTLDRMADGGIYDHLGGGFARYSTDAAWLVPHFEKMLYDNAQLARAVPAGVAGDARRRYRRVATETLDYVLREMQHAGGRVLLVAGRRQRRRRGEVLRLWSWDELVELVGPAVAACFGADSRGGNWEGTNVLWRRGRSRRWPPSSTSRSTSWSAQVEDARQTLFEIREARVRPAHRRQGPHRVERRSRSARSPRPAACSARPPT